jgi:hypothetical protein
VSPVDDGPVDDGPVDDGIDDDVLRVTLPYFEGPGRRWVSDATSTDGTYTDGPPISSPEQYRWNHGSARSCRRSSTPDSLEARKEPAGACM